MAFSKYALLRLLLVFLLLTAPARAEIKNLQIASDSRQLILFEKFGFTQRGHVNISVTDVTFSSADPSLLGFFLISDSSLLEAAHPSSSQSASSNSNNHYCVLSSSIVNVLFTFKKFSPSKLNSHFRSLPISHPDEYSLFFVSCARNAEVSMKVRTAMYNLGDEDDRPDFLSVGQSKLPTLFTVFALMYLVFSAVWAYVCLVGWRRPFVHRIHYLMGGLLVTKALNLLFEAEDQHYIKVTGTPHGWDVLFYLFQFLKGVLFFTVIVLIGTGWSFLKPILQDREKKVLMVVIPLQVLANIASVVIGETGPFMQDFITWKQVLLIVDIICCCAIMLPIVWSIRALKETSKTDGKAARNLAKLTLFRHFYVVVVGYLYFTRIVVFALDTIAAYKYKWVSVMASETASLAFYLFIFHMFRPTERNQYFVIDDNEEEAAQVALQQEDFEL